MLKIKDTVDLKRLKDYGMKYDPSIECYINNYKYMNLWVDEHTRVIYFNIDDSINIFNKYYIDNKRKSKDILYDLIKADLVEKVEDK